LALCVFRVLLPGLGLRRHFCVSAPTRAWIAPSFLCFCPNQDLDCAKSWLGQKHKNDGASEALVGAETQKMTAQSKSWLGQKHKNDG
jgi:hypothetical protein